MVLAAFPDWLSENLSLFSVVSLGAVALLVMRLVQKAFVRMILLGLLVGAAFFIYANQTQLELCAKTCQCRIIRQDVEVPVCSPKFPGE